MTTRPSMIVQSVDRERPFIGTPHVYDVVDWRPRRPLDWGILGAGSTFDDPAPWPTHAGEPPDDAVWAVLLPAAGLSLVLSATARTIPLFGRQVVWGLWHAHINAVGPDWDPMIGQERQRPEFVMGGTTSRFGEDVRAAAQSAAIAFLATALDSLLGDTAEEREELLAETD